MIYHVIFPKEILLIDLFSQFFIFESELTHVFIDFGVFLQNGGKLLLNGHQGQPIIILLLLITLILSLNWTIIPTNIITIRDQLLLKLLLFLRLLIIHHLKHINLRKQTGIFSLELHIIDLRPGQLLNYVSELLPICHYELFQMNKILHLVEPNCIL